VKARSSARREIAFASKSGEPLIEHDAWTRRVCENTLIWMSLGTVTGFLAGLFCLCWSGSALADDSSTTRAPVRLARVAFEPNEEDAILESGAIDSGSWVLTCEGPCEKTLPWDHMYRVTGRDYYPTPAFFLPDRERVTIRSEMRSSSTTTGRTLCIVGGTVVAISLPVFSIGLVQVLGGDDPELFYAGSAMMGAGLVTLAVGIAVLVERARLKESAASVASANSATQLENPRAFDF
jgi:hypothetical protein